MKNLHELLDQLQVKYHQAQFLSSDPVEFVHRYTDPWDQEAVALLAASLAYGNVKQIRRSVESAIQIITQCSGSPRAFVRSFDHPKHSLQAKKLFSTYVHRFNLGSDIVDLFSLLHKSWRDYGSLGAHFTRYLAPEGPNISYALAQVLQDWKQQIKSSSLPSLHYLLSSPADGSCCKRWCMFLRWMGRKDSVDPGLWTQNTPLSLTFLKGRYLSSHQLVMPLDTHTGRISQYLGLTIRKSLNWKAALEVTHSLQLFNAKDPTRYDFALSRLGILDLCQRAYRQEICKKCQLLTVCRFARSHSKLALPSMQS